MGTWVGAWAGALRDGQHPGPDQRGESQEGGGGIAPRGRDQSCTPELIPVQFGQPIDEPVQKVRRHVGLAIPHGIQRRVGQSEVGGQVDQDPDP